MFGNYSSKLLVLKRYLMRKIKIIKFIFIVFFLFSNLSYADQKDGRLNNLFDQLFLSNNNMEVSLILSKIWDIWAIAESEKTQIIFNDANQLMERGKFDNAIDLFSKVIDVTSESDVEETANKDTFKFVGDTPPLGLFDPLGFLKNAEERKVRKFREAELHHGRIAMVSSLILPVLDVVTKQPGQVGAIALISISIFG